MTTPPSALRQRLRLGVCAVAVRLVRQWTGPEMAAKSVPYGPTYGGRCGWAYSVIQA